MRPGVLPALALACLLGASAESGEVRAGASAFAGPQAQAEERALRKVLEGYVRAIEARDVEAFRVVKPNLSGEEEKRVRKAFASLQSQEIVMTIQAVELKDAEATIRVSRRDTINGSIVSSFPQTFTLARAREGWIIQEIGSR
jgi:hypothetical protein